jgi:hypothetical protein
MQLFPGADLRRRKDHGRAEALLLAWYGWQHAGPLAQPQRCGATSNALGTARLA